MTALTEPYYEALRRGELLVQHCKACGKNIMYPRHVCPSCYESELGWVSVSGAGVLHSFTIQHLAVPSDFENDVPYALGVVKLAENVQLLGRLWPEDGGWDSFACDTAVEFRPASAEEMQRRPVPWFQRAPQ
jgi:uncharacterized OB-fold protein